MWLNMVNEIKNYIKFIMVLFLAIVALMGNKAKADNACEEFCRGGKLESFGFRITENEECRCSYEDSHGEQNETIGFTEEEVYEQLNNREAHKESNDSFTNIEPSSDKSE